VRFTFSTNKEVEEYSVAVLALSSVPLPDPDIEVEVVDIREEDGIILEIMTTTQSSLPGRTGWPDPSVGQKGTVFGTNIHDLKSLEDLYVTSPKTMAIQVKKHIGEKMLDMPSFTRSVTRSESKNVETQAHMARALVSIPIK
jgi:hypothetical protein